MGGVSRTFFSSFGGRDGEAESLLLVRATDILVQFLFQACPADRGLELYEDEEEGGG